MHVARPTDIGAEIPVPGTDKEVKLKFDGWDVFLAGAILWAAFCLWQKDMRGWLWISIPMLIIWGLGNVLTQMGIIRKTTPDPKPDAGKQPPTPPAS
jgi:hypothetical protein